MADQIVSLRLTADARGLIAGVQLAKAQTDGLGSAGDQAGRKITASMGGATDTIRRLAAQAAAALSARAYVQLADTYSNIYARAKLVTDGQRQLNAAMDQGYAIAHRTYTGLESTAELYGRMQRASTQLGRSQADALRVTELINKTFQVSGTAAATANASIIQLAQGLGAGALRGDEFNSVLEGSPRLAQALADSLGVTTGGLRKMAEAGELSADKIITALLEQGEAIDAEFGQLPLTVGRAWTQVENAALVAIGKVEQQLGLSGGFATALQWVVGYLEKVPQAVALWTDAFAGVAGAFDLLAAPVADVIGWIIDEFMILPVSLRAVVTMIVGGFDQMSSWIGEHFKLLVIAGAQAWNSLEASASGVAGQLKILLGAAIDFVISKYAGMISGLANAATKLGMDSVAGKLREMAGQLQANASFEAEVRTQVEASAAGYRQKAVDLKAAAEAVSESAARERAAAGEAINAARDEREAALKQLNTKKELATASTATGAAIVAANAKSADSSKEAKKALDEQSKAMQFLEDMAAGYARELAGPIDQAWMDYEAAVRDATAAAEAAAEASDRLGAAGESEAAVQARLEAAIDGAAQARDRAIDAAERSADITGELLRDLEIEARLAGMTAEQRRVEEIVLRAVAAAREEANRQQKESIALDAAEQESLRQLVAQKLADIGASQRAADESQRAAEESARAWEDFAYGMADAVLDGSDGVKRYWKRLIDDLKRELIASGLMALFRGIFNVGGGAGGGAGSLLGAMFNGGGSGSGLLGSIFGGGGTGGGNLLGGLLGGLQGVGGNGLMGSVLSAVGSWLGIGAGAAGPSLMAGLSAMPGAAGFAGVGAGAATSAGLLSGSGLSTAFAGVPIIGWIAAAMAANMSLFAQGWRAGGGSLTLPDGQQVRGGSGSNALGTILTAGAVTGLDRALRGLGLSDSVASLLSGSSIHARLFGRRAPELTGQTTTYNLGADGVSGSNLYRILERGGVFRSDRRSTRTGALSDDAADAAQALFDSVRQVMVDSARALQGEAPAMLESALRVVQEFDKKGKVKSTRYFVDILGRTWEEATEEAATQRIAAEAMIATIDAILGTTVEAATQTGAAAGAAVANGVAGGAAGALGNVGDVIVKSMGAAQGEASAIAERWRDDAATLMDGAQMLLAAAVDIRAGRGLLGEGGTLTQIADLVEELQAPGEALAATYARVSASVGLLDQALGLMGVSLTGSREDVVRFAVDIAEAAGGLPRAQALWSSYFENFFTAEERLQYQLAQAQSRASGLFQAQGLALSDYTGEGGAAAFRALFEQQLPTLSAAAVVQWLEMAEALGIVIDLSEQASGSIGEVADTLAELMAGVTDQLAEYAPPPSFAEQLAAINTETEALIARAMALGASEEQLAQIRELGAARTADVLAAQADAYRGYADLVRGLADEAADARGLTDYQREIREVHRWTQETADALNAAARAAGMQAAAEDDLALMHEVAAARAAAARARLEQMGRDLASQLYGSRLEQIDAQLEDVGNAVGSWMGSTAGGMDQVTQATDNAVQALLSAQQRVKDWLDGIMGSELSGLRPKDRLTELLAQAERTRLAARGGDAEALARMPQLADEILRLGRDVYASGSQYFDLRDLVRGWMQDLADVVIPTPEPGGGQTGGAGGGSGGYSGGYVPDAISLEREQQISAQAAAERRALATELSAVIRDMMSGPDQTLADIEATLNFSMQDLVADLGVNLSDLTAATATQLADIAQAMGVELTDLAGSVGVSLGSLADRQSLLNDALEAEISGLPQGQRDLLEPLLRDVEEAAALGDTAGVEAGIQSMEDAIAEMSPDLRDALAPYFARIVPADPATELGHLATMETTLGSSLSELQAQTISLAAIERAVNGGGGLPLQPTGPLEPGGGLGGGGGVPPPGYAVGTGYVPSDGLAYLHRGEAVLPATVADFFRREGIPFAVPPRPAASDRSSRETEVLVAELRELREVHRESIAHLRAIEARVRELESTTARGDQDKVRAMERQTDAIRSR